MKKTILFTTVFILSIMASCSMPSKKKTERIPASIPNEMNQVDSFFEDIENAPSKKY